VLQRLARISHVAGLLDLAPEQQQAISAAVADVDERLRHAIHDLRPPGPDRSLAEAFLSTGDVRLGLRVRSDPVAESALPPEVKLAAYRAVQEAVYNAIRHARVDEVQVDLALDRHVLRLQVTDCGKGFDSTAPQKPDRFGLLVMRERVETLGGTLDIVSHPGRGTQVLVILPVMQSKESDNIRAWPNGNR
jgi:signal transduction histidine kinase